MIDFSRRVLYLSSVVNVPKHIDYWRTGAEEDIAAAGSLLEKGHPRHALFVAHLAVEKMLKALVVKATGDLAPRIHDLVRLAEIAELSLPDERQKFLADIQEHRFEDLVSGEVAPDPVPAGGGDGTARDEGGARVAEQSDEVEEVVRRYLEAVRAAGINATRAVLFCSHARGDAGEWSDIDIIVIAPVFDHRRDGELVTKLWTLRAYTDSRIEPIACGEREWETDDGRPILEYARREGIVIAA